MPYFAAFPNSKMQMIECTRSMKQSSSIAAAARKSNSAMGTATLSDVAVILPAAGSGLRFSSSSPDKMHNTTASISNVSERFSKYSSSPKQYLPVGNDHRPLLIHTVDAFSRIPWISHILLLVQETHLESTKSLIGRYGSRTSMLKTVLARGATTRHLTIQSGVKELENFPTVPSLVIIHDAVRPLVDEVVCQTVVEAARKHGASGVFASLVSTVLRINADGFMSEALPRNDFFASEMPQAFRLDNLRLAYNTASSEELQNGTECLALVHKYSNCQVKMIPVDPNRYFKVTFERDLLAVNSMLANEGDRKGISRTTSSEDFVRDARQAPSHACSSLQSDYP